MSTKTLGSHNLTGGALPLPESQWQVGKTDGEVKIIRELENVYDYLDASRTPAGERAILNLKKLIHDLKLLGISSTYGS